LWFPFLTLSLSSFPEDKQFGLLLAYLNSCNSNMIFFFKTQFVMHLLQRQEPLL
jgi:hypothetical protein